MVEEAGRDGRHEARWASGCPYLPRSLKVLIDALIMILPELQTHKPHVSFSAQTNIAI